MLLFRFVFPISRSFRSFRVGCRCCDRQWRRANEVPVLEDLVYLGRQSTFVFANPYLTSGENERKAMESLQTVSLQNFSCIEVIEGMISVGIRSFRPMVISPHGHFAPSHFAPTKSHFAPYSKSLRPIQESLCSIQKLLSLNIFISFRSVLSESDNLLVSTWQSDTDDYRSRR